MPEVVNVSAERIRQQILNILGAWGMPEDLAETTAGAMVETDLLGVDSHGISMLMTYEDRVREGRLDLRARPEVVRDGPAPRCWTRGRASATRCRRWR